MPLNAASDAARQLGDGLASSTRHRATLARVVLLRGIEYPAGTRTSARPRAARACSFRVSRKVTRERPDDPASTMPGAGRATRLPAVDCRNAVRERVGGERA